MPIAMICSGIIVRELLSDAIKYILNWARTPISAIEYDKIKADTTFICSKILSLLEVASLILPLLLLSIYLYMLYHTLHENDETDVFEKESAKKDQDQEKTDGLTTQERAFKKCLIKPHKIDSSFTSIGGLQKEIKIIKRSLLPITAHDIASKLKSSLMQAPGGILLYGPPGCGKTLMAKALAKEIGIKFMNIKSSDIKCCMYGKTETRITAMFTFAEKNQPIILFIDEIDSLLRSRSSEGSNELSVTRGIKNLFMQHMDGVMNDGKKQIIVIGATNRKEDIDAAILRRMHPQILIDYPSTEERKEIFQNVLQNEQVDNEMDYDDLANKTDGFSGSEIRDICKTAALNILEEVVQNLKHKNTTSRNRTGKESQDICHQMINDRSLNLDDKKQTPVPGTRNQKIDRINRPFTTDDIRRVISQWRSKDGEERDQFPMYI